MNSPTLDSLAALLRGRNVAALGTLQGSEPYVSMVPFAITPAGKVTDFKVLNPGLRQGTFAACMKRGFDKIRFPKAAGAICRIDEWPIPLNVR